jgi:hypothetical protein
MGDWLDPTSVEFYTVKYHLDISLGGKASFESISVYRLDTPAGRAFDKHFGNAHQLKVWKNAKNFTQSEFEYICTRGFDIGSRGQNFSCGCVDIAIPESVRKGASPESRRRASKKNPVYNLLLCDIAPGRSIVVEDKELQDPIPEGYDTYYKNPEPLDRNNDGIFSLSEYQAVATFEGRDPSEYQHTYHIKDSSRVAPRYCVRFQFADNSSPRDLNIRQPAEFLNKATLMPLTVEQSRDMLVKRDPNVAAIGVAYAEAAAEIKNRLTSRREKEETLARLLDEVDKKVRNINMNFAECQQEIDNNHKMATQRLQHLTKRKLEGVLSIEVCPRFYVTIKRSTPYFLTPLPPPRPIYLFFFFLFLFSIMIHLKYSNLTAT